jgi:alpha-glucuronidase
MFILYLAILPITTPRSFLRADEGLVLVHDGNSAYSICVSREASSSEKRAAAELQQFLTEISGVRLPIITDSQEATGPLIIVGKSTGTDLLKIDIPLGRLGREGFALKTLGKHLMIAGGQQLGTMYGVYTFLEKLGCRWFTPEVSQIPRMRTIEVPLLDEVQMPAFEYREPYFTEALDKNWAARS